MEYKAGQGFYTNAIERTRVRPGEGHAGRAALERCLVHVADLNDAAANFTRAALLGGEHFVTYHAAPLTDVRQISGVVFGFESADARKTGKIWVDNLQVLESAPAAAPLENRAPPAAAEPAAPLESAPPVESAPARDGGFCAGGMALPFGMFALVWVARKRR